MFSSALKFSCVWRSSDVIRVIYSLAARQRQAGQAEAPTPRENKSITATRNKQVAASATLVL